jgi:hypothetical protein
MCWLIAPRPNCVAIGSARDAIVRIVLTGRAAATLDDLNGRPDHIHLGRAVGLSSFALAVSAIKFSYRGGRLNVEFHL